MLLLIKRNDFEAKLLFKVSHIEPSRVDTVRSRVYIRPANVSPRHLALSGSIFPSLPADKLFPATHEEFTVQSHTTAGLAGY